MAFPTRRAYIRSLLPAAEYLERHSGIHKVGPLALAALLTSKGFLVLKDEKGKSLNNHFLLLDDIYWAGETALVEVSEELGGRTVSRLREFKRYPSAMESFLDFAVFLRSNKRFEKALSGAHEPYLFFHGLRRAAYLASGPAEWDKQRTYILYVQKALGLPLGWLNPDLAVSGWDM